MNGYWEKKANDNCADHGKTKPLTASHWLHSIASARDPLSPFGDRIEVLFKHESKPGYAVHLRVGKLSPMETAKTFESIARTIRGNCKSPRPERTLLGWTATQFMNALDVVHLDKFTPTVDGLIDIQVKWRTNFPMDHEPKCTLNNFSVERARWVEMAFDDAARYLKPRPTDARL